MTIDPGVVPGLLLLAAELAALAAVGYVIVRAVLRQDDERMALAQGLVVGPALWGLVVNYVLYVVPGMAGAAVGWGVMLALGAVLIWRAPRPLRPRSRTVAGFGVAVLALLWVALASRQLGAIPDPAIHLGLAAGIRAGGFPPELPWNAGMLLRYHYATDLLLGLLAPPIGLDLAFVTELLSAYAWTSFVLVVTSALLQRSSLFSVLIAAPLLLSNGLWSFSSAALGVVEIAVPAGLPGGGLRASLTDIYWPAVELAPQAHRTTLLPDILKPAFPLSYAVAFVVLEHLVRSERWPWRAQVTMAGLVGFLGLLSTTLVPVVVVLWAGLAVSHVVRTRRAAPESAVGETLTSGMGLLLAVALLLTGGGVFTGLLDGAPSSGLQLARSLDPRFQDALGALYPQPGGVGLMALGPLAVAGTAVVLAHRDRLVAALAAGAGLLVLVRIGLEYPPAPHDLERFMGHARNLALVALLLALVTRLAHLRSVRWRYAVGALLLGLVVWPTVQLPVRSLGLAVGNGVQLANAPWVRDKLIDRGAAAPMRRFLLPPVSTRIVSYIRDQTPREARVLSTAPPYWDVWFATGRPNNAGFAGLTHQFYYRGPEYLDAVVYLEPAAFRRLGIEYVHATDAWLATLPRRAQSWLADPRLFELVARHHHERLYRARRAFFDLDDPPNPASFEALRQAVPSSATVYFVVPPEELATLRVASALSHARLVGQLDLGLLHARPTTMLRADALSDEIPDLVVLPTEASPSMLQPEARTPIWWGDGVAVYAPFGTAPRIMDAPAPATPPSGDPPPLAMAVTDVTVADGRIQFAAAFDERTAAGWTSQDWIVLEVDRSPWAIPTRVYRRGEPASVKWFAGLLSAGGATTSHIYRFDARIGELSVRNDRGEFVPLATSAGDLGPSVYALALRLRHEYEPGSWRDAAVIPVLRVRIADDGETAFEIIEAPRGS